MSGNTFDGGQGTGNVVRGSTERARDKKLRHLAHVVHLARVRNRAAAPQKIPRYRSASGWASERMNVCSPGSSGAALIKLNCTAFLRRWCGISYDLARSSPPSPRRFTRHFFRGSVCVVPLTLSRSETPFMCRRLVKFCRL